MTRSTDLIDTGGSSASSTHPFQLDDSGAGSVAAMTADDGAVVFELEDDDAGGAGRLRVSEDDRDDNAGDVKAGEVALELEYGGGGGGLLLRRGYGCGR
jgi:hypothetical protein